MTTTGADAILAIQLRRLSRQERARILRERDDLDAEHRDYRLNPDSVGHRSLPSRHQGTYAHHTDIRAGDF